MRIIALETGSQVLHSIKNLIPEIVESFTRYYK